jgi:hypothetical protein
MPRNVRLRKDENTQALRMRDHTLYILSAIVAICMTVLYAGIRQTTIRWPMYRKALCIAYMPVKDIEVILVKHSQKIKDSLHREKLPASVEHEASMRIKIRLHLV